MVLEAVRRNGLELRFAAPKLQDDREVVLAACAQNGGALVAASKQLRADKQVVWRRRWSDGIILPKVRSPSQMILSKLSRCFSGHEVTHTFVIPSYLCALIYYFGLSNSVTNACYHLSCAPALNFLGAGGDAAMARRHSFCVRGP